MLGIKWDFFDVPVFSGFDIKRGADGRIGFRLGNKVLFHHSIQNIDLSLFGSFRKPKRRISAGRLGQACENRTFRKIQLGRRFVEIVFGGGLYAVCAVAQIDLI